MSHTTAPTSAHAAPPSAQDESADPVGDGHSDAEFAHRMAAGKVAAEPTPTASAPSTQDALALVHDDHQRIHAALQALSNALSAGLANADRQGLLARLALRLRAHGSMEAELLYPVLYPQPQPNAPAQAAEHEQFEERLQGLSEVTTSLQQQRDGIAALAQQLQQHFGDEERELARYAASNPDMLLDLGTRMALRRGELLADESSD